MKNEHALHPEDDYNGVFCQAKSWKVSLLDRASKWVFVFVLPDVFSLFLLMVENSCSGWRNSSDVSMCYFMSFNCELSVGKITTRFYFLPRSKRMSL